MFPEVESSSRYLCVHPQIFKWDPVCVSVYVTQNSPYSILKSLADERGDHNRGPLSKYGHTLVVQTLILLGPDPRQEPRQWVPPVANTETGEMQKAGRHPSEGRSIVTTQGQRKVSQASGANTAPRPWGPQEQRPTHGRARGGEDVGSMCQRRELPGRDSGKGNPMGQHWSPSDRQVHGAGTSGPGEDMREQRPPQVTGEKGDGTRVWENREQHPSQPAGAHITCRSRPQTHPPETLARFFKGVFSGGFITTVGEMAGKGQH